MTPSQSFPAFATVASSEVGANNEDDMVQGSFGGVTFTLSAPASASEFFIALNTMAAFASNNFSMGTNSFTLTWDDGMGGTQASSISLTGSRISNAFYITNSGSVQAQSNVAFNAAQVSGIRFQFSGPFDNTVVQTLRASINCFASGTMIQTESGLRRVESLQPGDAVMTADGRTAPVTWLGRQTLDVALTHPSKINPIRIMAGALGDGLPKQDLRLSPDHAIEIDGVLYNASALVNGVTIYQEQGKLPDGFTYYHIETEAHELLLAEGVPVESFVDYAGRDAFDNGEEVRGPIAEMDLPRISAARHLPVYLRERLTPAIAAE